MSWVRVPPDFTIFEVLNRHRVPFVIIGGHAVNYHGFVRQTEDTDVVWVRSAESEVQLTKALDEIKAQYIGKEIDPSTKIERMYRVSLPYIQSHQLMMLYTDCGFLDLFSYVPGYPTVDVSELYQTSIETNGLRYASLEWLHKMKKASGRVKDLIDLEKLGLD